MATFDISRVAFNSLKHYSSVRMQQGRVLTDDDWNENERIEKEILRRTQVDIIGRAGSPDDGFKIDPASFNITGGFIDFDILAGTIYTGGIRLEMDITEKFRLQKDWLQKNDNDYKIPLPGDFPAGVTDLFDLVYLETWQQPVSAVEDSSLFEAALGGPDTTTRLRNMRRVKIFKNTDADECPVAWKKLRTDWENLNLGTINKEDELIPETSLKVSFIAGDKDDLCSPSVVGGYLGAENQAIRVQVTKYDHLLNQGFFTWGFDNASPFYRVVTSADALGNTAVTMITEPKDQYHWPLAGQVVEILPWSAVLPNSEKIAEQSGFLDKVAISYDPDSKSFTLNTVLPADFGAQWTNRSDKSDISKPSEFLYMRVWNRGSDVMSPEELAFMPGATAATSVKLGNTGLQVNFTGTDFVAPDGTGNFWVIAARPSTPTLVVPWELSTTGLSPHGVRFFYSPLAIIKWINTSGVITGKVIHDCRKHFNQLTEQECCCTFTVGDGISSKGDFTLIQDAVDNLPVEGGKICILPGIHEENVKISGLKKIHLYGCGEQSIVRAPLHTSDPIFLIQNSQKIKIENLTLVTFDGIAIDVEDILSPNTSSTEISVRENRILACIHAVRVNVNDDIAGDNNIKIAFNMIGMYDKPEGDVAIFSLGDDVLIERNRIVITAAPDDNPDDPDPDPNGDPEDPCPCDHIKTLYNRRSKFIKSINLSFYYVGTYVSGGAIKTYKALGGIQVGCGSEKVWILQNEITGGKGNGITLGHFESAHMQENGSIFSPTLYDITIEENLIREMGLSGIGTVFHLKAEERIIVHTENLLICNNDIKYCVQELVPEERKFLGLDELPVAAISLAFCEDCIIQENWLEQNGTNQPHAVCGVYIFFAEKVDISENRIIDNGPETQASSRLNIRVRGGIVILFATRLPRLKLSKAALPADNIASYSRDTVNIPEILAVFDSVPAAKVHNNIVTQPIGQAFFLIAFGHVSVVGNQFTSQGINKWELFSLLAGSVFILNLGISKDLFNIFLLPLRNWGFINPSAFVALAASSGKKPSPVLAIYQLLPSGKTMYTANQVMLDMKSQDIDICLSSQLILCLDDIAFVNNQSECAGFDEIISGDQKLRLTIDLVLFNTILLSVSTRCNDNRFTDGFSFTFFSLLSLALMNTAVSNQSTHCLVVPFWAFRRKMLNIELNVNECVELKLEHTLSAKKSKYIGNPKFDTAAF